MSDFMHIKDWWKFRRGEIVEVHTRYVHPRIDGIYQLRRVHKTSNFPYRIWSDGEEILLEKTEVSRVGDLQNALRLKANQGELNETNH